MKSKNQFIEHEDCFEVIMKRGSFFISKEDKEKVEQYTWNAKKYGKYAMSSKLYSETGITSVHQYIMGRKEDYQIDHIDRDTNNNRRSNLRFVTSQENRMNNADKGYTYDVNRDKWMTYINVDGKRIFLGRYDTEQQAIQVRKEAVERIYKPILDAALGRSLA